jgi:hypothetical protein
LSITDLLAQAFGQVLADDASQNIGRPSGGEADDDAIGRCG